MEINQAAYQYNFSDQHPSVYDEERKGQKANKILTVLKDHFGQLDQFRLLDVGSSTGIITYYLSKSFRETIGIDIDEKAVKHAKNNFDNSNIQFYEQDCMNMNFPDHSFDVVNCTHIYEHVPDSKRLMDEIYRVLKPGGVCFFAAGNRLILIEDHYKLPLLSVMPKFTAHKYLRLLNKANYYYENHLTYWGLKKLTSKFERKDYTFEIIKDPGKYSATEMIKENSYAQLLYIGVLKVAYWLSPTYIWLLEKKE